MKISRLDIGQMTKSTFQKQETTTPMRNRKKYELLKYPRDVLIN